MKRTITEKTKAARVVIVDDILPNAMLAGAVLEGMDDVAVDIQDNAQRALDLCLRSPPDLILLDLVMPGLNGLEFLKRFREATGDDFTPVIVVTGEAEHGTLVEAMSAGATDFLRKPWDKAELEARTRNMLSLRRSYLTLQQKNEELRILATEDALTGVLNRRAFGKAMESELERMRRLGGDGCLLMMDIDFFKKINDVHGHGTGDDALRLFASHCREQLREIDLIGRLGGEEFAVFLPGTSSESAMIVADRLREELKGKRVRTETGAISMSVSIGLSEVQPGDAFDDLARRADKALYVAKESGRDRVTLAPPSERVIVPL